MTDDTSRNGFTLLEVLVAVTILGVAVVSLAGLHARNIRLMNRSQDMNVAAMLASRLTASMRGVRMMSSAARTASK